MDPTESRAVLLCGIGGVGKSTIANCLVDILQQKGCGVELIRFDALRKELAPPGTDPFSKDEAIKALIYARASEYFRTRLADGITLVIDSGLSNETIRRQLKQAIPRLSIIHVTCPLPLAVYRDTKRSLCGVRHERGQFLHLRAIIDVLLFWKKEKFPQPGITYPFEYPTCAELHINTWRTRPETAAHEIAEME
jgi:adenylylsulfate kinase-like enzyme